MLIRHESESYSVDHECESSRHSANVSHHQDNEQRDVESNKKC